LVVAAGYLQDPPRVAESTDQATKDLLDGHCKLLESAHVDAARINALGTHLLAMDKGPLAEDCLAALSDRIGIDVSARGYAELADALALKWGERQTFGSYGRLVDGRLDFGPEGKFDAARSRIGLAPLSDRRKEVASLLASGRWFDLAISPLARAHPRYPTRPALRSLLMAMMKRDQAARSGAWSQLQQGGTRKETMAAVDAENVARLRQIVSRFGFPPVAEIGVNGVEAFFVLSQHAVSDLALMKHVLSLAGPLLESGDLPPVYYALLTDRLRTFDGRCQLYGTQSWMDGGKLFLYPVEDPKRVNERRRHMLMAPLQGDRASRAKSPRWRDIRCDR
jgi:hypothetical protein